MELKQGKDKNIIHKFAIVIMCVYALLTYLSYMHGALNTIHSLCLYLMAGLAILLVLMEKKVFLNKHFLWYGAFTVLMMIYSVVESASISLAMPMVTVLIYAFSLSVIVKEKKQLHLFFIMTIIGAVILMLYLILTGQINLEEETAGRFGGQLTGNSNIFAAMYMIASIVTIYFLITEKQWWKRVCLILIIILDIYALVLAGGRKYFLVFAIYVYVLLLQRADKKNRKHFFKYTFVFIAAILLLYYLILNVPFLYETVGYRFEGFVEYTLGETNDSVGVEKRGDMIRRALELWKEKPILGHGLNAFKNIGGYGYYSHNNYVELLCNHGIVGFCVYYGMYSSIFFKLLKIKSNSSLKKMFIALIFAILFFSMGAITYNMHLLHAFLAFVCVYIRCYNEWENKCVDKG